MKIRCIIHGKARRGKPTATALLNLVEELPSVSLEVKETNAAGDARQWAAAGGCDWVISCGGDGTNNEVVNGIMDLPCDERPSLALIPIGSGNDFARNFPVRSLPQLLDDILNMRTQPVDVLQVTARGRTHYALNMVTCGIGAEIAATVNRRKFKLPAGLNYYQAIIAWLARYRPPTVEIRSEEGTLKSPLFLAALGNGTFAGNGLGLNPQSGISDGKMGVTTIGNVGVVDFLRYQSTLKRAEKVADPRLDYHTSSTVKLDVLAGELAVETDGESLTRLLPGQGLSVEVLPQAITLAGLTT